MFSHGFLECFSDSKIHLTEDGAMVRFIAALVAPVVPLTVMLCCMLLELLKPGSGINAGLQAQYFMTHCFSLVFWETMATTYLVQILVFDSGD